MHSFVSGQLDSENIGIASEISLKITCLETDVIDIMSGVVLTQAAFIVIISTGLPPGGGFSCRMRFFSEGA